MDQIQTKEPFEPTTSKLVREARVVIEFEEDPHRAALEDNPDHVHVSATTWMALGFLTISFGPTLGIGFTMIAAISQQVSTALGDPTAVTWVVGANSLASAVSYSMAGPLSDVFGRRYLILFGQALTIVGTIVGACAQNVGALIAAEAIIGIATGFLFVAYAGVPEMLPNKWRALGLGILEGGIALPWGFLATILGNILFYYSTWRWIFYIAIIVGTIALVGTALTYWPIPRPRGDYDKTRWQEIKEIDFGGLFLFTSGLTILLIGITWGGTTGHPWRSAGTIAPIVIGVFVLGAMVVYDAKIASNPTYPLSLLIKFRSFGSLMVVVFVAGMAFYPMNSLLPRGYYFLFTTDPIEIGKFSIPIQIVQLWAALFAPMLAHKLGHVKWQIILALITLTLFQGLSAIAVYPNNKWRFIFIPAFGVSMFPWITVLAYAIASLHIPHSTLGLGMGLLGSVRAAGGAVGNAILNTVLTNRFNLYVGPAVVDTALEHGLEPRYLPQIIPNTIEYNLGLPNNLTHIPGMTPAIVEALRVSVRESYGHAYKIVFYVTIPFTVVALVCSLFIEDPTRYMTNHTQFSMSKNVTTHTGQAAAIMEKLEPDVAHVEAVSIPVTHEVVEPTRALYYRHKQVMLGHGPDYPTAIFHAPPPHSIGSEPPNPKLKGQRFRSSFTSVGNTVTEVLIIVRGGMIEKPE